MARLIHDDAPGVFDTVTEDQAAVLRKSGWRDLEPSEPTPAADSSDPDGSEPTDTKKEK